MKSPVIVKFLAWLKYFTTKQWDYQEELGAGLR
jgi:hypothetical protein